MIMNTIRKKDQVYSRSYRASASLSDAGGSVILFWSIIIEMHLIWVQTMQKSGQMVTNALGPWFGQ